jgi:hypothetical protein
MASWERLDFLKAWREHGAAANDWLEFFNLMNAARVAAGLKPYKTEGGLNIQIGKNRKAIKAIPGARVPKYPMRPKKGPPKKRSLEEDLREAGLL